ncbi:hypothetical protein L2E82_35183 [Cichorium intybus]|uniref:Uncharacterized protein n=1 Tax=Cichorium intybus TaxID=13427 RepID=A0ACB9BNF9_CICIN|nr:hypothetical protein L2E82_35183 [Cichorium intybus]
MENWRPTYAFAYLPFDDTFAIISFFNLLLFLYICFSLPSPPVENVCTTFIPLDLTNIIACTYSEMGEEELEKIMEERYKPGSTFVKYAEDRTEAAKTDERSTHVSYVGRERHSAFCLMHKYINLKALGTKLQIISAFAVQHVKGFIYIEAKKQSDIQEVHLTT